MRRNHRGLRRLIFPDFVENACCNPCCQDVGVQAVRVEAAAENTCCGCCCCCGCCNSGCGGVAGAANGCGCNRGSVAGVTNGCRPRQPVWGDVGGIGYFPRPDFDGFCPCRDVPPILQVE